MHFSVLYANISVSGVIEEGVLMRRVLTKSLHLLFNEKCNQKYYVTDEAVIEICTRKVVVLNVLLWNHSFKTLDIATKQKFSREGKTKPRESKLAP